MRKPATFEINLDMHVYPVLHLARVAIAMEHMLAEIETTRGLLPDFHERMKDLGLPTDYGHSLSDYADAAILGATDLLEAHQLGPVFVVAPEGGAV